MTIADPHELVREWIEALETLREQTFRWADEEGWTARLTDEKSVGERGLGFYSVPIWEVETPTGYATFEPYRRLETEGSGGRVDVLSAGSIAYLERRGVVWRPRALTGVRLGESWDRTAFVGLVSALNDEPLAHESAA